MTKNMDKKKKSDQKDDVRKDISAEDIPDLNETRKELEELKAEQEALRNQLKRAVADYQNLEKRVAEGRSEFTSWAATELIKKLLVVLDHYEKAIGGASESDKQSGWFRGVELATQQLRNVLKDEGLEEIVTDSQFDPALHEAVDTREGEDNQILEVVEKGYNLNGKVVKPAKVIVGRQSS